MVADSLSILAKWRTFFSQLLNIHGFNDVRQTEIHTVEPLGLSQVPSSLSWLLKIYKVTNHQVLFKSQQNCLRQGVEKFSIRSIKLLLLFGIRLIQICLTETCSRF